MNKKLIHRGGDKSYIYNFPNLSLGMTGFQKTKDDIKSTQNEEKTITILLDGSIYNHDYLAVKSTSKGKKNKIISNDSELILNLYESLEEKCFQLLSGIYSICIYDSKKNLVYLIRDRVGNKPIYYYYKGERLIFSSEIKTLLDLKKENYSLNLDSILEYFLTMNISPESFFNEIKPVKPGSYLVFNTEKNQLKIKEYFSPKNIIEANIYQKSGKLKNKELIDKLDKLLNEVVKRQVSKKLPIGAICSGGVDSSLLAAISKNYYDDLPIFNVKIDDEFLDESKYAKKIANHLNLDLIEIELNSSNFKNLYEHCIYHNDLPFIHPCAVGIYLLCKKAKEENVKVILSGEGADELFGGYDHYLYFYRRKIFLINPFIKILNNKLSNLVFFDEFTSYNLEDRHFLQKNLSKLTWYKERKNAFEEYGESLSFIKNDFEKEMNAYILKDFNYYLPSTIREADRMAMAAGVEIRTPFLDNVLIHFASNLPLKYKINFFETKYLLKKVAERYLPKDIIYRKKMGFGIPVNKWLGTDDASTREMMLNKWSKIFKQNGPF